MLVSHLRDVAAGGAEMRCFVTVPFLYDAAHSDDSFCVLSFCLGRGGDEIQSVASGGRWNEACGAST